MIFASYFLQNIMKKNIQAIASIVLALSIAPFAQAAYNLTDPTDIWSGGIKANGKDVIGSALTISESAGNYSIAQFNANGNRYVFGMDTTEYQSDGSGLWPSKITLTEAVSGIDLAANFTGGSQVATDAGKASSASKSLFLNKNNFTMTFNEPVTSVGFVVSNYNTGNAVTVAFYSDASKSEGTLLSSYSIVGTASLSAVFFGYTSTGAGIKYVEMVRNAGSTGSALYVDDVTIVAGGVIPEPASVAMLIALVSLGCILARRSLPRHA